MKCPQCSRPLRVSGVAAFLILAAIAATFSMVQSSKAQTTHAGTNSGINFSGEPHNGKLVFESQGCNKCHGSQGEGISSPSPNIRVAPIDSATLALPTFIQLVRKPKGRMPPFGIHQVSDRELTDVYAFLHFSTHSAENEVSIATNPGNGQRLFSKYGCYECHLSHGQGSRTTGVRLAPPVIPLSAFIGYIRQPTGEMPPYTQKTVSNDELADMYAFLQSVQQPSSWTTIPLLNR